MTDAAPAAPKRPRRDLRLAVTLGGMVAIGLLGFAVTMMPDRGVETRRSAAPPPSIVPAGATPASNPAAEEEPPFEPLADPRADPAGHARQARTLELKERFEQAVVMLHAKRYDEAVTALGRVMELNPRIPEAHVNMGFALFGKEEYAAAFEFFMSAIDLNPEQANAYYGIAMVQDAAGNLEGALGGMRSYLHLTDDPDPHRLHTARARSAIWEWEARLGRGPWGPTRGIPPGFTEEELKRDGRGVAVKMPIGDSEKGPVPYKIEAGDRTRVFDRQ
jgi:hypothetical protein